MLVGILNITQDSFFDGGKYTSLEAAEQQVAALLEDGAQLIDIGAESTNPKSVALTSQQEIARLGTIFPELAQQYPLHLSLDTYHPETLQWALQYGTPILNDVSGLANPAMAKLVCDNNLTCIVGHLPPEAKGLPINAHTYKLDDFELVVEQLLARAKLLEKSGIARSNIILDPNIGFGKTMRLNWRLVKEFASIVDYATMIGFSHKRFLGFDENGSDLPKGADLRHTKERNIEAAQLAIKSGAKYLRVHEPVWYINPSTHYQ